MQRRRFLTLTLAAGGHLGLTRLALAQGSKGPVQLIVPFTPAGVTDTLGRVLGEALSKRWGQSVVVENRPGASGYIGAELVSKASPDGHSLLIGTSALLTINPHLMTGSFDPIRDLTPITTVGTSDLVIVVNPALPVTDMTELVTYAKRQSGGVSFASPSNASTHHLTGELLQRRLGIKLVHVPYKGSSPGLNDVIAGHVPMMIDNIISALPYIRAGRLRAIAVSGSRRSPSLPEIATFEESGLESLAISTWFPLVGPKGMPLSVADAIQQDVAAVLGQKPVRDLLIAQGIEPLAETPARLRERVARDLEQWKRVIKDSNVSI